MTNVERKYRILVIEDDPQEVRRIEACLNTCSDFEYLGAVSRCEEGIKLSRQHKPDCVILDLELEQGHGLYFLNARKEGALGCMPAVMVLTAVSSPAVVKAVHRKHSDGFFLKESVEYKEKGPAIIVDLIREVVFLDDEDEPAPMDGDSFQYLRDRIRAEFVSFGAGDGNHTLEYLVWAVGLAAIRTAGPINLTEDIYKPIAKMLDKDVNAIRGGISYNVKFMLDRVDSRKLEAAYTPSIDERSGAVEVKRFITYFANRYRD